MHVSILIATFNRAGALRQTLERFEQVEVPAGVGCEVIVIDNNSSDHTASVIHDFIARRPDRFQYLFEGRQGKSTAINSGVARARGDVLVFTDDDCVPDRGWLSAIVRAFVQDAALDGLGGRVELFRPEDLPVAVRTSRTPTLLASTDQLFSLIPGCNMAFRRRVLDTVGGFDQRFGPGARIAAAEDADLVYRIFRRGFKVLYTPEPVVYHNHGRTSEADLVRLNRLYVIGRGAFYAKHILQGDGAVLKLAYWETRNTLRSLLRDAAVLRPVRAQTTRLAWLARGMAYGIGALQPGPSPSRAR
jgi:GT2 family glycosyltransferase